MGRSSHPIHRQWFTADYAVYWSNLSRLNNLLVIVNISMFFLTGLVAQGYYYTFFSLVFLGLVGIGAIIPTRLIQRLWFYWVFVAMELAAIYFLVASIIYWVSNGSRWG